MNLYNLKFLIRKISKSLAHIVLLCLIYYFTIDFVNALLRFGYQGLAWSATSLNSLFEAEKWFGKTENNREIFTKTPAQDLVTSNWQNSTTIKLKFKKRLELSIANPHYYNLIIEPSSKICSETTFLIAMVTVGTDFFEKRLAIRSTWANLSRYPGMVVLFLLGKSPDEQINKRVQEESSMYQDIIQEDFLDSYDNLTLKVMMGFKWICQNCKFAKFVLKIDDDVVANTRVVLNFLMGESATKTFIGNYFQQPRVVRDQSSKFYLSYQVYPQTYFPPYFGGSAYILTNDLTCLLFEKSLRLHFPPFSHKYEDVYIGMLLAMFRLKHRIVNIQKLYSADYQSYVPIEKIAQRNEEFLYFIYTQNLTDFNRAWDIIEHIQGPEL